MSEAVEVNPIELIAALSAQIGQLVVEGVAQRLEIDALRRENAELRAATPAAAGEKPQPVS